MLIVRDALFISNQGFCTEEMFCSISVLGIRTESNRNPGFLRPNRILLIEPAETHPVTESHDRAKPSELKFKTESNTSSGTSKQFIYIYENYHTARNLDIH